MNTVVNNKRVFYVHAAPAALVERISHSLPTKRLTCEAAAANPLQHAPHIQSAEPGRNGRNGVDEQCGNTSGSTTSASSTSRRTGRRALAKCSASATTCGSTCWSRRRPDEAALQILAAAHAYQTSSARDELARHYQAGAELLGRTPNLLIVSTNGAGYDTVDVKACTERGILVVNQSGGNAEAVAEHVIGMMLCLVKRVGETDRALRAGTLSNRADYIGREAFGKTIGIVGLGNVGRRIAELCRRRCSACRCWPTTPI